jgi:hypothetical protein
MSHPPVISHFALQRFASIAISWRARSLGNAAQSGRSRWMSWRAAGREDQCDSVGLAPIALAIAAAILLRIPLASH